MKLLIADDHTLFRDALVQYIERSDPSTTITLCSDLFQAFDRLDRDPHQDIVILDLRMPGMDGMAGLKTMKEKYPQLRVALMSGVAEPDDVEQALGLGVCGYFPKTLSGKALLQAIRTVLDGQTFIPRDDKNMILPSYYGQVSQQKNKPTVAWDKVLEDKKFTTREKDVLTYLVRGATNKEIAQALDLQVVTVKLHVSGICRKLDAKNRTQAALYAQNLGVEHGT